MNRPIALTVTALAAALSVAAGQASGQDSHATCKSIHADLLELRTTTNCKPTHPSCFIGEVDGNHGLRGTTYFKGDSATPPIPTSPEFVGYSGVFEYTTERGTLVARESGVTSAAQRVVTAYQKIIAATGDYEGASGFLFVSGENDGQRVTTKVTGEICYP